VPTPLIPHQSSLRRVARTSRRWLPNNQCHQPQKKTKKIELSTHIIVTITLQQKENKKMPKHSKLLILGSGPALMERMKKHAERFETQIIIDHIHTAQLTQKPYKPTSTSLKTATQPYKQPNTIQSQYKH